jgi:hypothetical protein
MLGRVQYNLGPMPPAKPTERTVREYFADNIKLTTSVNFNDQEVSADRAESRRWRRVASWPGIR